MNTENTKTADVKKEVENEKKIDVYELARQMGCEITDACASCGCKC